jgi:hypothetical protein
MSIDNVFFLLAKIKQKKDGNFYIDFLKKNLTPKILFNHISSHTLN